MTIPRRRKAGKIIVIASLLSVLNVNGDGPWSLPGSLGKGITTEQRWGVHTNKEVFRRGRARIVVDDFDEDLLELGVEHDDDEASETCDLDAASEFESKNAYSASTIRSRQTRTHTRNHHLDQLQLALSSHHEQQQHENTLDLSTVIISSPLTTTNSNAHNNNNNNADTAQAQPLSKRQLRSTGTTIAGCIVENGTCVVLAADTRATDDRMVADKRCEKVHTLASNVWCCGAGTSADLDSLVRRMRYTLALKTLTSDSIGNNNYKGEAADSAGRSTAYGEGIFVRPACVSGVCRLLRDELYEGGGSVGANLVLGGYDMDHGVAILTAIHPHGSMDVVPYAALGSGGLAAMSVLENRYHTNMTLEEGVALIKSAIAAGILNDLGSGSQIDMCVIGPNGSNYTRGIVPEESDGSEIDSVTEAMSWEQAEDGPFGDDVELLLGVNGFGNMPYSVKSRRIVTASLESQEQKQHQKWDTLLGL